MLTDETSGQIELPPRALSRHAEHSILPAEQEPNQAHRPGGRLGERDDLRRPSAGGQPFGVARGVQDPLVVAIHVVNGTVP